MKRTTLIATLAALVWASAGQAQWAENMEPSDDTPWRKTWGEHGALLQLTEKADEMVAAIKAGSPTLFVAGTETATRGVPLVGVIFFAGCDPDPKGLCDTAVTLQVFKPDGTPYGEPEQSDLWVGRPPPKKGQLQLGMGAIGVKIEPDDPMGKYTVRAHLHDKVSGAKVELSRIFEVKSGPQSVAPTE